MSNNEVLSAARAVSGALGGLEKVTQTACDSIGKSLEQLYAHMAWYLDPGPLENYVASAAQVSSALDRELSALGKNFSKLKAAMTEAVAPIGLLVVPLLNQATQAALGLVKTFAMVMRALFGGAAAGETMEEEMTDVAKASKKVASSGSKASRTLARFDQINRLAGSKSSGSSGGSTITVPEVKLPTLAPDTLTPQIQAIIDKIQGILDKFRAILEPLKNIDFSPLLLQLSNLGRAFVSLGSTVQPVLESLWYRVLTPFVTWIVEQFAPAFLQVLTAAIHAAAAAFEPMRQGAGSLLESLKPVFSFMGQTALRALEAMGGAFTALTGVFLEKGPQIYGIFENVGNTIGKVYERISPLLTGLQNLCATAFAAIANAATTRLSAIIDGLGSVTNFLENVFSFKWSSAWTSIKDSLRGVVNSMVGFLNKILSSMATAINSVVGAVNRLSFQVPAWVPGLGGKRFGFSLSTVTAPSIPYLAQGAVLPANKPFLAVVGDQRHGTNVEAPLTTIQEAVAGVMADYTAGNMAGHEATVATLRQILEAVLGISIGDELLANAVQSRQSKMAVVRGGLW